MKAYWISVYKEVENQENLKKYAEVVTPIIMGFGGIPLVRGGKHITYDGDDFIRTVIWEFPSYEKAIECHNSKKYLPPENFIKLLNKKFSPYCSVATWYLWRSIDPEPIQY